MANARDLLGSTPARMMIVGHPGSGKTGAIAALANAGYKIRMLDYDGNPEPLLLHCDDRALDNVDIVALEDDLRDTGKYIEAIGIPHSFNDGLKLMKHWKYTDENGVEIDLGRSKDWGPDTVVVLDSMTSMGDAAFMRSLKAANRTPLNCTHKVWGSGMSDQENFVRILRSAKNRFHLIILCHLKLVGPEDIEKDDDELTKEIKEKVAQIVPHRQYPWALGQKLSPKIGGKVPTLILAEAQTRARKTARWLVTEPRADLDLKVPAKGVPKQLPLETGLLTIFEMLGHKAPGFAVVKTERKTV